MDRLYDCDVAAGRGRHVAHELWTPDFLVMIISDIYGGMKGDGCLFASGDVHTIYMYTIYLFIYLWIYLPSMYAFICHPITSTDHDVVHVIDALTRGYLIGGQVSGG